MMRAIDSDGVFILARLSSFAKSSVLLCLVSGTAVSLNLYPPFVSRIDSLYLFILRFWRLALVSFLALLIL